ncbi:organic solute transporter subunit alpha-like [Eriocheir sinensis]|uniref:organic solute transporter subunit alpha-like n=1 Tax=Eriocheir sinensis TaxID=95602 RepID=UPI0021C5D2C8|nr:organic solute transporter subunit alpha-like [Eriocheir sinensis]
MEDTTSTPLEADNAIENEGPIYSCERGYFPTEPEYHEALGMYWTGITAVAALITAVLVLFYIEHIVFSFRNTHSAYRRHINWIACFYPIGALMSLLALIVPRAYSICMAVKIVFFSLGISHFTDLTVTMFGCEKAMLAKLKDAYFTVCPGFCRTPTPHVTKIRLRGLKWMLWQLPYTQTIYFFFEIYWTRAESDSRGLVNLSYSYLVLDVFNALSFLTATYAFFILFKLVGDQLRPFNYKRKASTLLTLLIVLKVPGLIINIVGNYDFFPCIPPYISSMMYGHTVVSLLHLCLVPLFGGLEYWQYHTREFLQPTSDKHHSHSHELIIHGEACVCIISELNSISAHKTPRRMSATMPIVLENKMALDPQFSPDEGQNNNDGVTGGTTNPAFIENGS